MTEPDFRAELAALRTAALEDIMATRDADLRREAVEDGEVVASIALDIKATMREAAAAALRQRMAVARQRMDIEIAKAAGMGPAGLVRPAIDRLKQLVREAFANDPNLGLAFRDGKHQSDADWESLYDDLVSLGKIEPGDHAT